MKKILVLCVFMVSLFAINTYAQPGGQGDTTGRAARMQQMKDRTKPGLMEAAKLTDAEANQVLDIYYASRGNMRGLRDLSDEDRKKKMDEMQADTDKKFKTIPLTDEKIKLVNDYMATQMRNRGQGGPGTQRPPQQ
jgi:Spy/CpxP family protein refolding chaperone